MKREALPPEALVGLEAHEQAHADAWWSRLAGPAREEFRRLWDERTDDTSLYGEVQSDGSVAWRELPIEIRGLIVEGRSDHSGEWNEELYDYLIAHPESVVLLAGRTFHVCRAHAVARAALRDGVIPVAFECPLADAACPLRAVANHAGADVHLCRTRDSSSAHAVVACRHA